MSAELLLLNLGTVPYREAWDLQLALAERRGAGEIPDVLMLLEHPPVYSRGRRTKAEELPMGDSWYEAQGIEVLDTDRGGLVTYHGPGQLVAYPILDLGAMGGDVHAYVRGLERVMIDSLADHDVGAQTIAGLTGVWTDGPAPELGLLGAARKIGSIGVHVSKGITTHGLAVNVDNDLQPFEWVVPCGIEGVSMTSIRREGGSGASVPEYGASVARRFGEEFGRELRSVEVAELGLDRDGSDRDRVGPEPVGAHDRTDPESAADRDPATATLGGER